MSDEAGEFWARARKTVATAAQIGDDDPDMAASCAYYAAFYAISALFAARGVNFRKHTALHAAVHRDLVRTGEFPKEFGSDLMWLVEMRELGTYGSSRHVSEENALRAVDRARDIIEAISRSNPALFPLGDEGGGPT